MPVLASHSTPHLPPGSCDVIFIADTYHHREPRGLLRAPRDVLRPGGRLAILEVQAGSAAGGAASGTSCPRG
ncbi:MAG: methyltransferase domain-containing protein [Planctomycetes bacterium]|nr:methyltransferase domain-containing protein [Planctomycetota bacterium]